jgi:hypothetical protein
MVPLPNNKSPLMELLLPLHTEVVAQVALVARKEDSTFLAKLVAFSEARRVETAVDPVADPDMVHLLSKVPVMVPLPNNKSPLMELLLPLHTEVVALVALVARKEDLTFLAKLVAFSEARRVETAVDPVADPDMVLLLSKVPDMVLLLSKVPVMVPLRPLPLHMVPLLNRLMVVETTMAEDSNCPTLDPLLEGSLL